MNEKMEISRINETPANKQPLLEKMSDFFTARVNGFDEHMLNDVKGCKEGYIKMAELIPEGTETILDLGCGTFSHAEKVGLYTKIHKALNSKGVYIECDYMVTEQSVEDELFAEYARLKREMNITDGEFYHFDIPCTIDNQISMLKKAGFLSAEMVWFGVC